MLCVRWNFFWCLLLMAVPGNWCQYEGSPCSNPDGTTGDCRRMLKCPVGLKMLRTSGRHNLHRCGFKDFDEIVCCPDTGEDSTTTTTQPTPTTPENGPETRQQVNRKCVVACEAFMNKGVARLSWHIINGVDAEEGEFPHMTALGYQSDEGGINWDCGGALIAEKYVLTAAHCIIKADGITPAKIRMGVIDLTNEDAPNKQDMEVEEYKVHPDYKRKERFNDIAILKLKNPMTFNRYVQPACLYTENDDPLKLTITGWGVIDNNMQRSWTALQKAPIFPANLTQCKDIYLKRVNKIISEKQICAADTNTVNTTDTCQGDSGGPLQVENLKDSSLFSIVGVTSYGMGCGTNHPSIYTRVSQYLDFIEAYVWPD